jgi:hypothetical protein
MWHKKHHWRYKNITLLAISIVVFFILAETASFKTFIANFGEWGYAGAIITGIFSVMTFTAAPALAVLYAFSERLNPLELSLLAGLGSVVGDFIIFSFFKDTIFTELEPIIEKLSHSPISHIFHSRYFIWLTPVVGALIIASPLPDELGVPLLSANKMKKWHFIILSFILNSLGIWLLLTGTKLLFN